MFFATKRMLTDLAAVCRVPVEQIKELAEKLGRKAGRLSLPRLYAIVKACDRGSDPARAVGNALYSISPGQADRIVSDVQQGRPLRQIQVWQRFCLLMFFDNLHTNLRLMGKHFPALELLRKAERLEKFTGDWCDSVDVICDVRPVFNDERNQIEGLIPVQTLQLGYTDRNGNDVVAEIGLSEDDASELIDKLKMAQQKIAVKRKSVSRWIPGGWIGPSPDDESAK